MNNDEEVKVYWQPGCSSCLKTKEFLMDNGIPFKSVNVLEDKTGFEDVITLIDVTISKKLKIKKVVSSIFMIYFFLYL